MRMPDLLQKARIWKKICAGCALAFFLALCACLGKASAAEEWNPAADIERLSREVPSIAAFEGHPGVTWMKSHYYTLMTDGTMLHARRLLLVLRDEEQSDWEGRLYIPAPAGEDATVEIGVAGWYDPATGVRLGTIDPMRYDQDGLTGVSIPIPDEARGNVVAIESLVSNPKKFYLDDFLPLSDRMPVWEQVITVEIPEDMDFYWRGVGVREPRRVAEHGAERITWTVMNQPADAPQGIVEELRPMLAFSLQRGLTSTLKTLRVIEDGFNAPPAPAEISTLARGGNLQKTGAAIARYMQERRLEIERFAPVGVRAGTYVPERGPWTKWERTLIAAKWLERFGWSVRLYWSQKVPLERDGPASTTLWNAPLIVINLDGGRTVYYTADQAAEFGRLDPLLYGDTVYRSNGLEIEQLGLPRGTATDHTLTQTWRLTLGENGIATGQWELTVGGGWVDVLGLGVAPEQEGLVARTKDAFAFFGREMNISVDSIRQTSNGYRITYDVSWPLGIVSGSDILVQHAGAVPRTLNDMPESPMKFSFLFPFVHELNMYLSTPDGYRSFSLPEKVESGDSKSSLQQAIVFWPKKGRFESNSKWVVRNSRIDEYGAGAIIEQFKQLLKWMNHSLPLRK